MGASVGQISDGLRLSTICEGASPGAIGSRLAKCYKNILVFMYLECTWRLSGAILLRM
jgi:hypothetical protein